MIYLFNNQEQLIKIIRKTAIQSLTQKQTLTDTRYVSDRLTAEVKALDDDVLEQVEYIAIPHKADNTKFHLFFMARHETNESTALEGTQSGIEELRKKIIKDQRPTKQHARPVIERLLNDTNWQASYVDDSVLGSTNFYYESVFDSLLKVCEVWNLEMQFFVEVSNNKIGARYIDFKKKIGKNSGARVVYGHNALQIIQEAEKTELVTAAIGRGKGEQVSDGSQNPSGQAGYGRKINFADIVWSKANGDPVNKPKGQEFVELPNATARYGIKTANGMVPKVGVVEFDTEDRTDLLKRTYEWLLDNCRPKMTFKTTTAYLKGGEIGDTIRVVKSKRNLDYETRIFEITWDRLAERSTDVKLGDRLNVSESLKTTNLTNKISDTVGSLIANQITDYLPSANGFNKNWYRTDTPPADKVKVGDTWYKPDTEHEGHFVMYTWDGENWVEIVRTYKQDEAAREVEKLKAQSAKQDELIKSTDQVAKNALAKAGVVETTAEAAQRIANTVKTDLATYVNGQAQRDQTLLTRSKQDTDEKLVEVRAKLAANTTQISELQETATAHQRTLTEQGTSISRAVQTAETVQTEVRNLKVGGRNYALDTQNQTRWHVNTQSTTAVSIAKNYSVSPDFIKNATSGKTIILGIDMSFAGSGSGRYGFELSIMLSGETSATYISLWKTVDNLPQGRYYSKPFTVPEGKTITSIRYLGAYKQKSGTFNAKNAMLEIATTPSDWTTAPEDTDAQFSAVGARIDAAVTRVTQLSNSWSVQNLTSAGTVLGQLNLTDGNVKIDGKLVHITGKTLIDDAVIDNSKIKNVSADKIKTGVLDAGEVTVINLNANNITTGYLTGNRIAGGIITANNGAMEINLRDAKIDMHQSSGIEWHSSGNYLKFHSGGGVSFIQPTVRMNTQYAAIAIGVNSQGQVSSNSDLFAGIKIFRDPVYDTVDILGDTINFQTGYTTPAGWTMITWPNPILRPSRSSEYVSSRIWTGDVHLFPSTSSTYYSLTYILKNIRENLLQLHKNKTTETSYNYSVFNI